MKIHHSKIYGYQSVTERCLSRFSLSSCGRYRRKTSLVPTSSPWFPLSPDRQAFACSLRQIACMSFRCSELKTWRVPSWSGPCRVPHTVFILWQHRVSSSVSLVWYYFSSLPEFTDLDWLLSGYTVSNTGPYKALTSYTLTEWRTSANKRARSLWGGNELQ